MKTDLSAILENEEFKKCLTPMYSDEQILFRDEAEHQVDLINSYTLKGIGTFFYTATIGLLMFWLLSFFKPLYPQELNSSTTMEPLGVGAFVDGLELLLHGLVIFAILLYSVVRGIEKSRASRRELIQKQYNTKYQGLVPTISLREILMDNPEGRALIDSLDEMIEDARANDSKVELTENEIVELYSLATRKGGF